MLAVMYSFSVFALPAAHALEGGNDLHAAISAVDPSEQDRVPSDPHHHDPDCVTCLLLTLPGIDTQTGVAGSVGITASPVLSADAGILPEHALPTLYLRGPPTA